MNDHLTPRAPRPARTIAAESLHGQKYAIRLRSDRWTALCAAANLRTETEIAAALGISRQHIWRIHSGERAPGADFIAAVLVAFPGLRFEHLFAPASRGGGAGRPVAETGTERLSA